MLSSSWKAQIGRKMKLQRLDFHKEIDNIRNAITQKKWEILGRSTWGGAVWPETELLMGGAQGLLQLSTSVLI